MIKIEKLTAQDRGREVSNRTSVFTDYGRITSWNDHFIFVRYHTRRYNDQVVNLAKGDLTSQPTKPKDLDFA